MTAVHLGLASDFSRSMRSKVHDDGGPSSTKEDSSSSEDDLTEDEEGGSRGSSDEDDAAASAAAELRARMAATLSSFLAADLDVGAVRPETTPTTLGADDGGAEDGDSGQKEEQEAGIRLFSHSTRSVRVWSSSPSGPDAGGGFVVPRRPMDHYVASQPDAATRERLAFAAVSGDEVLAMARRRNWGLELPWRVMHISAADGAGGTLKSTAEMMAAEADGGRGHAHLGVTHSLSANKKKRPGKKTRIAQRTKARKLKAKAEVEEAERRAKEAHLRDKKKRLNRSKKLRRREKEREKKLQKAVGGGLEDAGQQNAARAGSAGEDGASD